MTSRNVNRRLAIISCEPDNQEPMRFRGKQTTVRDLLSLRFKELGLEPVIHRPIKDIEDFPTTGEYGAVVIGGSKLSIFDDDISKNEWMARLLDFIRSVHEKVPVLGICYGHQAVARAFGATIEKFGPEVGYEVGFATVRLTPKGQKDVLFQGMPKVFDSLFSHFDYVPDIPVDDAALLSVSMINDSLHAFRVSDSTWGIQFHPEYSASCILDVLKERSAQLVHVKGLEEVVGSLEGSDDNGRVDAMTLQNFVKFVLQD